MTEKVKTESSEADKRKSSLRLHIQSVAQPKTRPQTKQRWKITNVAPKSAVPDAGKLNGDVF